MFMAPSESFVMPLAVQKCRGHKNRQGGSNDLVVKILLRKGKYERKKKRSLCSNFLCLLYKETAVNTEMVFHSVCMGLAFLLDSELHSDYSPFRLRNLKPGEGSGLPWGGAGRQH